jgi:nucleoside-diphosphate-sugar epimerase
MNRSAVTLVTGARGFVGRAMVTALARRGTAVRGAVRALESDQAPGGFMAIGDMGPATDWSPLLHGVGTVVHLAARVHMMQDRAADPLAAFRAVNVEATLNLVRQAAAAGVGRFVFVSSVKVHGERTLPGHPFTERDAPNPMDPYGVSKLEAETGLQRLAADSGLELVIVRPPLVYGPGVGANFAALLHAVRQRWPLPLGAMDNARSLVALDNLVDFLLTCITHPKAANQTFLVSDGQDLSTPDLVRGLAQAAGVSARLLPVPVWMLKTVAGALGKGAALQRLSDNLQVDISKGRALLGWVPPVSVDQGLKRAMDGVTQP